MKNMKNIKKILTVVLFVVGILMFGKEVNAANKLYFTSEGDRIYYDSGKIDDNTFMNHDKMVPGQTYTDELLIENGSDTDYTLYFKVVERDQSEDLSEFLDHIQMTIYLDDKVIYEGKVKGLDYTGDGINLQNAIELGKYSTGEEHKMVIETTLEYEYSDTTQREASRIGWQFYAEYEEKVYPIEPNPNTIDKIPVIFGIFAISILVIVLMAILFISKERKA